MVTPCVQLMWLLYPSLTTIYIGLCFIGLCYSVRASAAYVFISEGLLSSQMLRYCVYQFVTDGVMVCSISILYWAGFMTWRRMILLNMSITLFLIYYLMFHLHESPQYLYSKDEFCKLKDCLSNIAQRNGVDEHEQKVERIVEQLRATK